MNLEQIDTSTTAGKADVMRLAAEGRRVARRFSERRAKLLCVPRIWEECVYPGWNWGNSDYAIISEPVGPDEVWCVVHADGSTSFWDCQTEAERWAKKHRIQAVRYIRADLAGEKG
ncbi:hypothetical protein PWE35_09265 [Stenotrophomonas maltophilia]|uniref:hypothetical protein n=1 Tax=Stenotrophomonas maltophilia TaxID=40324 RepID=UPI00237F99BA|nr:hypothetical protein [Stenotrophomonas maltophilia]WDW06012.1 hypothetical protein PWE35_09265 [Stenotrophomonas maltophilia]